MQRVRMGWGLGDALLHGYLLVQGAIHGDEEETEERGAHRGEKKVRVDSGEASSTIGLFPTLY